ncbi:efflux RND transporter periplasmic adaptor subunit [Halioglobus maricola]|nr:efflux RND transporter periplasmic adaptor subunit [Halioglobus maricola]
MLRILMPLMLGITLAACGESGKEGPVAPAESTAIKIASDSIAVAAKRLVRPSFELPAVVEAVQMARVRPEISATIREIKFSPGQMVEEGDVLMELDTSAYQAAYDTARAQLQSAQASQVNANSNWDRAEDLMPKGYISQQDYDGARAAIDSARAAVASAKAALNKAELDLSHTTITAPFSGKISKSYWAIGDTAMPSSPNAPEPLFILVSMDPVFVTAGVQLEKYHEFVLKRKAWLDAGKTIPELEVGLKLSGGSEYPHSGVFEAWDNTSSASSGTITGRVLFPNPDGLLLPGNNVTLEGKVVGGINRIVIPQKAVLRDQQGEYVKIVDSSDTLVRRNVDVGIRDGADWVIIDGLEVGDRVVTAGAQRLREGAKVAIQ